MEKISSFFVVVLKTCFISCFSLVLGTLKQRRQAVCRRLVTSKSIVMTSKSIVMTSKSIVMTSKSIVMTSKSIVMTKKSIVMTKKYIDKFVNICYDAKEVILWKIIS